MYASVVMLAVVFYSPGCSDPVTEPHDSPDCAGSGSELAVAVQAMPIPDNFDAAQGDEYGQPCLYRCDESIWDWRQL